MSNEKLYVSDVLLQVCKNGVDALFQPGVPRPVRASLVPLALAAGAREYTPAGVEKPRKPASSPKVEVQIDTGVVEAVRMLVEAGDPDQLTSDGKPKVSAVEALVGYNISSADRDAAWDALNERNCETGA